MNGLNNVKVLFLGSPASPLIEYLKEAGDEVVFTDDDIDLNLVENVSPDFIISYGYRHIIAEVIIERYVNRAINLHISYLPWNRGADPNLWSLIENTPKGATIHYLDKGIDTGDIIVQKKLTFSKDDTLRTSYDKLQYEIQTLFKENWGRISTGRCERKKQNGKGSYHRSGDKKVLNHLLVNGWDTPISVLQHNTHQTNEVQT